MESVKDFFTTAIPGALDPTGDLETARQVLLASQIKRREEDGPITPRNDTTKAPRLLIVATDIGRAAKSTPIRTFRLEFQVRGNAKVDAGKADPMHALTGALETILDGINLKLALDSQVTREIAVMLAVRDQGIQVRTEGDIRTIIYGVTVKAVGTEHTVRGWVLQVGTVSISEGGLFVNGIGTSFLSHSPGQQIRVDGTHVKTIDFISSNVSMNVTEAFDTDSMDVPYEVFIP